MILRGILYMVGFVAALLMAGRLFATDYRLARLFGAMLVAWAVNCALLLALLVYLAFTGIPRPEWADLAFLVNSALLAAGPVALYIMFPRGDGQ
jgi:prolipoprotein diacylglyceryltransferase